MRRLISQVFLLLLTCSLSYAQGNLKAGPGGYTDSKKYIDGINQKVNEMYVRCPDSARQLAESALLLSEKIKYTRGTGFSYYNLGHVYWSQSYYPISLFYLNTALTYIPKTDSVLMAMCYNAMARTYLELKNFKEAELNYDRAGSFATHNPQMLSEHYSGKALLYTRASNYDKAMAFSLKALVLSVKIKDEGDINILYTRLGNIYRLQGKYPQAFAYSDSAFSMSYKTGNKRLRAKMYVEYAEMYNELHQFDKAIDYAHKGVSLSDSIGLMDGISSAYKAIMFSYEQKRDPANALAFQKRYSAALDSVNTSDKKRNTELIHNYFELDAKLKAIEAGERKKVETKEKIHFQSIIILILSISLLLVLLALYITYFNFKQKKLLSNRLERQHEALMVQKGLIEEQSENLVAVNKLKDKLLTVIGHDLRTPMANLRSIISLFKNDNLSAEDMHSLMKKMELVIKGAELTLNNLLEWAGSQIRGINVTPIIIDINTIGDEMAQTYDYQLQQKNIRFQNVALTGHHVKADEKHIKVIIGNLVSNAIKFTDDNGTITLSSSVANKELVISINDTGKGIADDKLQMLFNLNSHFTQNGTMGEVGTGIGLFLCKELVSFNSGKLWAKSEVGTGSTFSFSLPLAN